MRIAVFGSYRESDKKWAHKGGVAAFRDACRELGRHFARLNQTIIVGGVSENTADLWVVEGFVEVKGGATDPQCSIRIMRPEDTCEPYQRWTTQYPNLFEHYSRRETWWEGAHLQMIEDCDIIVTIGGGKGTYLAGLAAIGTGKRTVPIASFGGASAEILRVIEARAEKDTASMIRRLNAPWTLHVRDSVVNLARIGAPRLVIIHGRSKDWLELADWLKRVAKVADVDVMEQQFGGGSTLPEKWEKMASHVDAAIAIATPDDQGGLTGDGALKPRARQNVWLEVGWFWGRLGRDRVLLLLKNSPMDLPSDLQGMEYYQYNDSPTEQSDALRAYVQRLK